ncbi:MAG: response regulator [Candidatus Latescibacteria bacterium]|jgi:CheY-like chemotaxis protein|nr:response regulator [Candidatus Latescibacterota bacterium]MDP7447577.1 response regulator [Candidatus Latescibacterota bacterium]HJP33720.1 response regulator [Candidatus Latescibacterota bacterium]
MAEAGGAGSLQDVKILVVDDVPANIDVLYQLLQTQGVNVLAATSGEQALAVIEANRPDLILLDIRMPGMDGVETCRRLKEMDGMADLPVIFLTAEDDREKIAEGYEAGGIDYVPKPVEKDALLQLVRSLL